MEHYFVFIGESGVGGGKTPSAKLWTISTDYIGWRLGTGEIEEEEGRVSLVGDDKALEDLQQKITPYSIIEIRGEKNGNHIKISEILQTSIVPNQADQVFIAENKSP